MQLKIYDSCLTVSWLKNKCRVYIYIYIYINIYTYTHTHTHIYTAETQEVTKLPMTAQGDSRKKTG